MVETALARVLTQMFRTGQGEHDRSMLAPWVRSKGETFVFVTFVSTVLTLPIFNL